MEIILPILLVSLVITIIVAMVVINQKHNQAMQAVAQDLHLQFFPNGNSALQSYLTNFELFSLGSHKKIRNLMMGSVKNQRGAEIHAAIFEYFYTVGHHSNTETYGQTIILFYDPSLSLPRFSLRSEHLIDKIANQIGFRDINFPESPQFSQRYRLHGENEGAVRRLFQPNLLKFYAGQKDPWRVGTEANSFYLMIFSLGNHNPAHQEINLRGTKTIGNSRILSPQEIKTFLELGLRLNALLARNSGL